MSLINRSTVQRATVMPSSLSARHTRRGPNVSPLSANTFSTCGRSCSSRDARADGGRVTAS